VLELNISGDKIKSVFDLSEQAKKLKETLKTPAAKLSEVRDKLSAMFQRGFITAKEFTKAFSAARESLIPDTATGGKFQQIRSAFIDVAALNPQANPVTELQQLNKKTETSNELLRELNLNARGLHTA
jgi:hypothetical protein